MRILYITQKFYPESLAAERFVRQAAALQGLGHEVTVLTSMPFYPAGRVHPAYRWSLVRREQHQGISIVRVWSVPSANRGLARRALSFVSFALIAAVAALVLRRRDLIIAAVPNPGSEFAGIVASRLKRSSLLLEMVDLVPENLAFVGMQERSTLYRSLRRYYQWAYQHADMIGVLCSAAADVLVDRGIDPDKIFLMPNASDPDLLDSISPEVVRQRHSLDGAFVVVYAGSFSHYYRVGNILAAAAVLRDTCPQVRFVLLGEGSDWPAARAQIERERLTNVTLTGALPRGELGGYLQAADLFIASMVADRTPRPYQGILTAKACDYLLVGRPIVAVEDGQILGGLLERIGAGTCVQPEDPEALAAAIVSFARDGERSRMAGARAAEFGREHVRRDQVVARFERDVRAKMRRRETRRSPPGASPATLAERRSP